MNLMKQYAEKLAKLDFSRMYGDDFFLTWDKSDDELAALFTVADALRCLRENNISTKIFDSGLGISLFRDNSTRTRFSFASACNLLGLEVQDLDEGKSQIAHGETVRETANMISFMADVIGIRDDMYIGKGHTYQKAVSDAGGVRPDGGGGSFDPLHAVQLLSQRGCARDSSLASMAAGSFSLERKIMAAMM